jgi:iron complex outermembrane receptor protein
MKTAWLKLTASIAAVVAASVTPACAQDVSSETAAPEEAIVVTGSRIVRPELDNPMPVSVVNMDQAGDLGLTTAWDALIREPSISPGIGRANAGGQAFDGGTASINLRNMGANRTLTLVDGQRRASGSARSSAVDLNMIPAGMIDRIEVITGGAAAIYGADAVTGAVNVITKRNVKGLHLTATAGISERGDAATTSVSLVTGAKFGGGRGSVVVGATYVNSQGLHVFDRDYANRHMLFNSNPANTGPADGIPDSVIYDNWSAARLNENPTFVHSNLNYVYLDGRVQLQNINRVSTAGEYMAGTGEYFTQGTLPIIVGEQLIAPLKQFAFIGRFDYELTDTINYTARFDYGHTDYQGIRTNRYYVRDDSRNTWFNGAGGSVAYLDNPYLPGPIRQFMTDRGLTSLPLARMYPEFGVRWEYQKRDAFTVSNELAGELVGDLKWNAFFQYGRSVNNVTNPDVLRGNRWIAARNVISDPGTGAPVCRDVAARAAGCVPYNVFGREAPTAAQREWLFADRNERWLNTQTIYGGSVVGSILSLPYGDISFALGAEQRRDTLSTQEDPLAVAGELGHAGGVTEHAEIDATLKVTELYGELVVPLLRDVPVFHRLEVEGAYRYSDYNTFGANDSWKVGVTWVPVAGITLRGVRSRSVRVPNFGELYEPTNTAVSNLDDPCETQTVTRTPTRLANCAALGIATPGLASQLTSMVTTGGNPNLTPETANSLTLGVIVQPQFLRGFDVTLDYWDIDIKGVIAQFSANQVANYCVDLPTIQNVFCGAMTRDQNDPVRSILTLSTQQINASNMKARGIDFGVNFRRRLAGGQFHLGFKGTYLIEKGTEAVPGIEASVLKQMTGYLDPRFRGNLFASYSAGGINLAWNLQIRGASFHDTADISDEVYSNNAVPARAYNDVSIGYSINDSYQLTLGVNNLLDVKPPYLPATYTGAGGIFDTIGRRVFASVNVKF